MQLSAPPAAPCLSPYPAPSPQAQPSITRTHLCLHAAQAVLFCQYALPLAVSNALHVPLLAAQLLPDCLLACCQARQALAVDALQLLAVRLQLLPVPA